MRSGEWLHTPCYIFDEDEFEKNIEDFQRVLNKYFEKNLIGYSFKTNSLPCVITAAKQKGCFAETVSDTEYGLALKMGYEPRNIIFNGPIKGKNLFREAIWNGSIVNIDSAREIEWLKELSEDGFEGKIGIRVNIDLESVLSGQTLMGEAGGRFGFCEENASLSKVIHEVKRIPGLLLSGLHMHVSSKTKSTEVYRELARAACKIADREQIKLEYLDLGGGFFGGGDGGAAYEEYVKAIYDVLKGYGMEGIMLIVEPGASVVATAVDYVTKVVDVKETNRNCFVVTDGSRLHIDPFFHKTAYAYSLETDEREICGRQVICGYTCMENDRLMELADAPKLIPEDMIIYHVVGAYTVSFNSLFIEYFPAVYRKRGNIYQVARERWGIEEYLQGNRCEIIG